jgi:hypothetical protein
MRRSPRLLARLLVLAASLSVLAACGNGPACDAAKCGTGGAAASSSAATGGAGGAGGAGGQLSPTFPCKAVTCMRGAEVCDVTTVLQQNAMGACSPIPAACKGATADCTCFGDLMGCNCQKQPTGEFDIFCDKNM